jgi:hypothetical protein
MMTFENPSLQDRILELQEINRSMQQLLLAQTETIKTQNQTIQNQNNQIQGMQTQLMTVIHSQIHPSGLPLVEESFPDSWEAPAQLFEDDDEDLEAIQFPDIFTTEPTEQPAITGEDSD